VIRPRWSSRSGRGVMNQESIDRARGDLLRELIAGPDLSGAACTETDPDLWYPEKGGTVIAARTFCRGGAYHGRRIPPCPVRKACLERALDQPGPITHYGMWAGYTAPKLRRMRALRDALRRARPPASNLAA